jgi:hypothetical protein
MAHKIVVLFVYFARESFMLHKALDIFCRHLIIYIKTAIENTSHHPSCPIPPRNEPLWLQFVHLLLGLCEQVLDVLQFLHTLVQLLVVLFVMFSIRFLLKFPHLLHGLFLGRFFIEASASS